MSHLFLILQLLGIKIMSAMIQEMYVPDSAYDQRQPYQLIYLSIFEYCNTYCRHKIGNILNLSIHTEKSWSKNEDERGYALEQLEGSYTFAIEYLMFSVALLILDGGVMSKCPQRFVR